MKRILTALLLICSMAVSAQSWTQIAGRQRFIGNLGIPVKDTVTGTAADSAQIVIRPQDGNLYFKYKGAWTRTNAQTLTSIPWDSVTNKPTVFATNYSLSNDVKDSILARLAIRDTANMLAPYALESDLPSLAPYMKYSDTASMLTPYVRSSTLGSYVTTNTAQTVSALKTFDPSLTTSGKIARSLLVRGLLTAAADSDTLAGLDVFPTFNNNSKNAVKNYYLRVGGDAANVSPVYIKLWNEGIGSTSGGSIEWPYGQRIQAQYSPEGFRFYNKNGTDYWSATSNSITWTGSATLSTPANNGQILFQAKNGTGSHMISSVGGYHSFEVYNTSNAQYTERLRLNNTGVTLSHLAGTGNRMVVASSTGLLSTQDIPSIATSVQYSDTAAMLAPYSRDYNTVHKSGVETITGGKFFNAFAQFNDNVTHNGAMLNNGNNVFFHSATFGSYSGATTMVGVPNGLKFGLPSTATTQFTFPNIVGANFTFPNSSGTLALTSDIPSLSGYVQGSGASGQLSKFNGTNSITNSQIYDNGTTVGVGTAVTGADKLVSVTGSTNANDYSTFAWANNGASAFKGVVTSNSSYLFRGQNSTASTAPFWVLGNGRTSIGNGTDDGTSMLQVYGNTTNTGTLSNNGVATFGNTVNVYGDVTFQADDKSVNFASPLNRISGNGTNQSISLFTNNINRFHVNGVGAATFSSSVTAGSFMNSTYFKVANSNGISGYLIPQATWLGSGTATNMLLAAESGNSIGFMTNGTTDFRMFINTSGNVGIGTTTPYSRLDINGGSIRMGEFLNSASSFIGKQRAANGVFYSSVEFNSTGSEDQILFNTHLSGTSAGERMRINGRGDVLIGSTSSAWGTTNRAVLEVGGSGFTNSLIGLKYGASTGGYLFHNGTDMYLNQDQTNRLYVIANNGGVYLTSGATSWTANSDERLKNINSNIDSAVDKLMTLRTVNFSWKTDSTNKENLGLIAQDVQKVFPQVIDKGKLPNTPTNPNSDNTEYLGVRYQELVPVLIKAIQELKTQNENLQHQITELKNKQ